MERFPSSLRRQAAQHGDRVQRRAAQSVDTRGRNHQTVGQVNNEIVVRVCDIERRTTGLDQIFDQHVAGSRTVLGLLDRFMVGCAYIVLFSVGHAERNAVRCDRTGHRDRYERRFLALGKAVCRLLVERLDLAHGQIGLGAEHLVVHLAGQITVGKAVTREHLAQDLVFFLGRAALLAQQIGVNLGDNRAVLRALHATFDLKRRHAHLGQGRNPLGRAQVFERERISLFARVIGVRQAAGLGTQAAIARALTDDRRHVALTRVAHAQRTVHKDLGFHARLAGNLLDLVQRALARQHNAGKAQFFGLQRTVQRVNGHLGGRVQRQVGSMLTDEPCKTQILHDERICARFVQKSHVLHGFGQLTVEGDDVECNVGFDPAGAAVGNGLGHLLPRKVLCTTAGIERAKAQIDGVCTALHGCAHALKGTGRG